MANSINSVSANLLNSGSTISDSQYTLNNIKALGKDKEKEQLKKVGQEFETMFITKLMQTMDKMIDREGGILGEETRYIDTFKNHVYQEFVKQMASNPHTSIGLANHIYKQMEKYVQ